MTATTDQRAADEEYHLRWRITRAFGSMPYGGIADFDGLRSASTLRPPEPMSLSTIADNLDKLSAVLARTAEEYQAQQDELFLHRRTMYQARESLQHVAGWTAEDLGVEDLADVTDET